MAQADKNHFGKGTQGKGTGAGAMSEADGTTIGDNQVLSTGTKSSIRRSAAKTVTRSKPISSRITRPIAGPRKLRHANFKNRRYPPGREVWRLGLRCSRQLTERRLGIDSVKIRRSRRSG
jgi:hypothetical protein